MTDTQKPMAALTSPAEENNSLRDEVCTLKHIVQSQAARIAWFEKQLFGSKSEKRIIDSPQQFNLLTEPTATEIPIEEKQLTITYQRGFSLKHQMPIFQKVCVS